MTLLQANLHRLLLVISIISLLHSLLNYGLANGLPQNVLTQLLDSQTAFSTSQSVNGLNYQYKTSLAATPVNMERVASIRMLFISKKFI